MEKKTYKKPLINAVIDLGDEICGDDMFGETRWRVANTDGTTFDGGSIVDEDPNNPDFWKDWNFAKKSTIWDDEDEEY